MKKKIIFINLFVASFMLFATENILQISFEKICESLATTKYISGDFELSQVSGKTNKELKSAGTYFLSADDGIITYTTKPVKMVMAVTEAFILQEMNGKVKKTDGSNSNTFLSISKIVSSMFTGKYEQILCNFEIEFRTEFLENRNNWVATFIPKDKTLSSYIKIINLSGTYSKNDVSIEKFSIEKFNKDKSIYQLKNKKVLNGLSELERKYFEK